MQYFSLTEYFNKFILSQLQSTIVEQVTKLVKIKKYFLHKMII